MALLRIPGTCTELMNAIRTFPYTIFIEINPDLKEPNILIFATKETYHGIQNISLAIQKIRPVIIKRYIFIKLPFGDYEFEAAIKPYIDLIENAAVAVLCAYTTDGSYSMTDGLATAIGRENVLSYLIRITDIKK